MIIDPRYLMQIAAIVECGSFSAAAERLGTSQPALSRTISIIERRTGLALFDRNSRPPTPTDAGRALADQGRAIRKASNMRRKLSSASRVAITAASAWVRPHFFAIIF